MALKIDCLELGRSYRCTVEGDLDLAGQAYALEQLLPVIEGDSESVVLDLSGVEFIDSTGLRVLLACQQRAEDLSRPLLLTEPSEAVVRLFRVTKIGNRFRYLNGG